MTSVFVVEFMHLLPNGEESVFLIGVYRTEDAAHAAVTRLSVQPGFRKHPRLVNPLEDDEGQGFYVSRMELDQDHWTEGFVTMIGDQEYKE